MRQRLPLNTLPAFRAVARTGTLRAAAESLHLTHSAISQQIRQLEQQIGFELFERRGRRVVLNPAGATLLRAVEPALDGLDAGLRAASVAAGALEQRIRLTLLPSFAQRWLLPRMARWRARHPDIGLELHASQQVVDLQREGFHAALRQGAGQWRGLLAQPLLDSPLVPVGSPAAAARVAGRGAPALAEQPLLGSDELWARWFAMAGHRTAVYPVASFNDAGLMLQAAEQDIGIALAREVLAADALREGRLVQLSPHALADQTAYTFWLVVPPEWNDWPPIQALRAWLLEELARSLEGLPGAISPPAGTTAAGR